MINEPLLPTPREQLLRYHRRCQQASAITTDRIQINLANLKKNAENDFLTFANDSKLIIGSNLNLQSSKTIEINSP